MRNLVTNNNEVEEHAAIEIVVKKLQEKLTKVDSMKDFYWDIIPRNLY